MTLILTRCRVLLAAGLLILSAATCVCAQADVPPAENHMTHNDLEVLTTCQMYIYSSIVLQVYDLSSIENQSKSKLCGVDQQFTPAQSLEEISRLFADYGMEKTANHYNISFDENYIRQVLELTEIILKTYQSGYEKALRQQMTMQSGNHAFCSAFIHDMNIKTN